MAEERGYIDIGGITIQWFSAKVSTSEVTSINYPKPFKEGAFQLSICYNYPHTNILAVGAIAPNNKESCLARAMISGSKGTPIMRIIVVGY